MLDDAIELNKLASLMDEYYKRNDIRLGEWLFGNKKIDEKLKNKLKGLEKFFYGGGSPTLEFLKANSVGRSNDIVKEFRDFARENDREDVVIVLNGIHDDVLIKDLEENVKEKIAYCLDRHIPGVNADWRVFAHRFGHDFDTRKKFKEAQTAPNEFSPTRALIGILKEGDGTMPIQYIIDWAESESRNDISNQLNEFIATKKKEKTKKKQKEETILGEGFPNNLGSTATLVLANNNQVLDSSQEPFEPEDSYCTNPSPP